MNPDGTSDEIEPDGASDTGAASPRGDDVKSDYSVEVSFNFGHVRKLMVWWIAVDKVLIARDKRLDQSPFTFPIPRSLTLEKPVVSVRWNVRAGDPQIQEIALRLVRPDGTTASIGRQPNVEYDKDWSPDAVDVAL